MTLPLCGSVAWCETQSLLIRRFHRLAQIQASIPNGLASEKSAGRCPIPPCPSSFVAFSPCPKPESRLQYYSLSEADGFGGREMTSKNVPDTFSSLRKPDSSRRTRRVTRMNDTECEMCRSDPQVVTR